MQKGGPGAFLFDKEGTEGFFMFSWGGWRVLGPFLVGVVPFLRAMQTEKIKCI